MPYNGLFFLSPLNCLALTESFPVLSCGSSNEDDKDCKDAATVGKNCYCNTDLCNSGGVAATRAPAATVTLVMGAILAIAAGIKVE